MADRCIGRLFAFAACVAAVAFIATFTVFAHEIKDQEKTMSNLPYVGTWVTEDNHIRLELLLNGRYVEARGNRERACRGQYWVTGVPIDYKDDTGFTADGDFRDGDLHHAGMVLKLK